MLPLSAERDRVIDLYAELAQALRSSPLQITSCNLTGALSVRIERGTWQPDPSEKLATIIPVFAETHACPHRDEMALDIAGRKLPLIDLLAFRKGEMALRVDAVYALGEWNLDRMRGKKSLNIYSDPIKWLNEGQNGVVILDWNICAQKLIEWPQIVADNLMLGMHIKMMVEKERERRTPPMPKILIERGVENGNGITA